MFAARLGVASAVVKDAELSPREKVGPALQIAVRRAMDHAIQARRARREERAATRAVAPSADPPGRMAVPVSVRARGRRLAQHLAFIEDHADYEDEVLYPFVAARVPSVARAVAHAQAEHGWIGDELPGLLAAVRAGRRYRGPLIEGLRHHFAEEEADIWAPALAAGLRVTPEGEVGHLVQVYEELVALRAE